MLTLVNINNRQNERPSVCFHDMFGKKYTTTYTTYNNCDQHFKAWSLSDFCVSHQLRHAISLSFLYHTMETKRFENPASFLLKTPAQKFKNKKEGTRQVIQ